MAVANVNGVRLFYELSGVGQVPLVFVHGSWGSHHAWDLVVPKLANSFRVLTYDRRGHSQSERPTGQGSILEDVADLAALMELLELAPAWVVGSSFGASITLRLAVERPELLRGAITHEPPLFALLANDPSVADVHGEVVRRISAVAERIASGDGVGAAEQFVETVALGPGAWAKMPRSRQQTFIDNATTFLDEVRDPDALSLDLARLQGALRASLLTVGDQSPATFALVVKRLAGVLSGARVVTFSGAGHAPHVTHPEAYVQVIESFIRDNPA